MGKRVFIFDMDGVLVDSEPIYKEIMGEVVKELELGVISKEYYASLMGMAGMPMWEKIVRDFGLKEGARHYFEIHKRIFLREILKKEVVAVEGVVDFVHRLKEVGYRICVASSAERMLIEHFLGSIGIFKDFEAVISGAELERSKPFPDIFLKAAEAMGARPEECVVVEDSANGVEAAKRAGMYCIGYDNVNSEGQDLGRADIVVNKFKEIKI